VEVLQVPGGGAGRLLRVAPLVEPPVELEAVAAAGVRDELPDPLGLGPRVGVRLERALDHGQVGEVLGHALGREHCPDLRQVLLAAAERGAEPVAQTALVEVDAGEDRVVQLDGEVVRFGPDGLEGRRPHVRRDRRLGVGGEVGHLVDRGRLDVGLGKPIAGGDRVELRGLDGVERPPVGVPERGAGVGAARRVEVDVDRVVERLAGLVQVALLDLFQAGREMGVSLGDQLGGGILGGLRCFDLGGRLGRCRPAAVGTGRAQEDTEQYDATSPPDSSKTQAYPRRRSSNDYSMTWK
jgi:hypothetical protein